MSIARRTVFYGDSSGGMVRFLPFAMVETTAGTMVEPFEVNQVHSPSVSYESYDPTDEVNRVDSVERIDLRDYSRLLSYGQDTVLHGGEIRPRAGGTK